MNARELATARSATTWSGVDWDGDDLDWVELASPPAEPAETPTAPALPRPRRARAPRLPLQRSAPSAPATHLLLIDLENIGATPARPLRARRLLEALLAAAPSADRVVAVAAPRMLEPQRELLAELGIEAILVRPGPDAADLVLLATARSEVAAGCQHVTVASADHCFAALASICTLHVIERAGHPVAKLLRASAHRLTLAA